MSEYNEKICPVCKNLNYIDADHCYWCKYKFTDKNPETNHTYYCKYCNTPIEVNEYHNKSKGVVCKKCRMTKIGYNFLFYFLGIVIYLILSAILFSFGFKLGYLFSLLLFFVPHKIAERFMLNKSSNNSMQEPVSIKSNNKQSSVNTYDNCKKSSCSTSLITVDESTKQGTFNIDGVTINNHQQYLEKLSQNNQYNVVLKKNKSNNDPAVSIIVNGFDIGKINKNDINYFYDNNFSYSIKAFAVNYFYNENKEKIYYAKIQILFHRINMTEKEDINKNLTLMENSQNKLIDNAMQQTDKKSKKRYCKLCGGIIDRNTKKCTNCGKQYFKFNVFRNYALTAIISIIVTASIFGLIFLNLSNSSKPQLSYFESSVGVGGKHLSYAGKPDTDYYVEVYLVYNTEETLLDAFTTTSNFEGYIPINIKVDEKGLYEIMIYNQNKDDYLRTYFMVE